MAFCRNLGDVLEAAVDLVEGASRLTLELIRELAELSSFKVFRSGSFGPSTLGLNGGEDWTYLGVPNWLVDFRIGL